VARRRVSFVVPRLTDRPRSGGELRSLRLAQALGRAADLTVIVVGPPVDTAAIRAATGAREVLAFAGATGVAGRLLALRRRWPLAVARAWNADAARVVSEATTGGAVTIADFLDPVALVPADVALILSLHNVERDLDALPAVAGWRGMEQRLERIRMRRWETRVLDRRDLHVVVPSEREAASLRTMPIATTVVPNGTDVPPVRPAVPSGGTVLFVGALDYGPNQEGLRWWAEQVWPQLAGTAVPALTVVGRAESSLPRALVTHESLRIVGAVDDVTPYVDAATVSVVPLLTGGGTRIKLVEALAHGRPTVTTTKGAEGVGVTDGVHVAMTDDPKRFAELTASLWSDAAARERLSVDGYELARGLDWRTIMDAFAERLLG
jgi:glycosyltransferase involved in cell wall biosynthesis